MRVGIGWPLSVRGRVGAVVLAFVLGLGSDVVADPHVEGDKPQEPQPPAEAAGSGDGPLAEWLEGAEETFVAFPTYAAVGEEGDLTIPVHAWVFEPEAQSVGRRLFVRALEKALDVDGTHRPTFRRRVRPFLVDNERGKTLWLRFAGHRYRIGRSRPDGHVQRRISIPAKIAREQHADRSRRQSPRVELEADFGLRRTLEVPVVDRHGISVISDIDDTIKVTEVHDRDALLANTFLRAYRSVPGMARLYRRLRRETDARFHYVSASPWQLLPFLRSFMSRSGFPDGTYHLRKLRPKSLRTPGKLFSHSGEQKRRAIERLLDDFPHRRFIFIGDSTEQDPELAGSLARACPDQIVRILIRTVPGADNGRSRFERAFRGVPPDRWFLFEDPETLDLDAVVPKSARDADEEETHQ